MRRAVLTLALVLVAGLAVVWAQGGLDGLARWAAEGQRSVQNAMAGALRRLHAGEAGRWRGFWALPLPMGSFTRRGRGTARC